MILNISPFLPTGSVWCTFVNSKQSGDNSDHHQPSGTNKKDTYRHTTGDEQRDIFSAAHTQMHTHTPTGRSAGGKQRDPSLNFNLCGAAYDTRNDTAHLRCLCFLYSEPSVKKKDLPLHFN